MPDQSRRQDVTSDELVRQKETDGPTTNFGPAGRSAGNAAVARMASEGDSGGTFQFPGLKPGQQFDIVEANVNGNKLDGTAQINSMSASGLSLTMQGTGHWLLFSGAYTEQLSAQTAQDGSVAFDAKDPTVAKDKDEMQLKLAVVSSTPNHAAFQYTVPGTPAKGHKPAGSPQTRQVDMVWNAGMLEIAFDSPDGKHNVIKMKAKS